MDKQTRETLTAELHEALVGHMGTVTRMTFIMTGHAVHPMQLVEMMEASLETESVLIGTMPSRYSASELRVRRDIAYQVVAGIRRAVQGHAH